MSDVAAVPSLPGGGRGNNRFRALVMTAVPEAATLDEADWQKVEAIIARALAARPAAMRRQLGLFVRVIDVASRMHYGRRLTALGSAERTRLLETLGRSWLLPLRRGVWGIRTLAFMGYYARPEAAREIGYRASAAGWRARSESHKR
jgi:hypothetical protein